MNELVSIFLIEITEDYEISHSNDDGRDDDDVFSHLNYVCEAKIEKFLFKKISFSFRLFT